MSKEYVCYSPKLNHLTIVDSPHAYKFKNEFGEFFTLYGYDEQRVFHFDDYYIVGEL